MSGWTPEFEADLTLLLKDWLKQQGRTQSDLRRNLRAVSTRMPALLEVLERETILATLEACGGHRQNTARALRIGVRTLGLKLRKWKDEGLIAQDR